jgi:hypothetical protein
MDSGASLRVSLDHDVEARDLLSCVVHRDERETRKRLRSIVNLGREGGGLPKWRLNDIIQQFIRDCNRQSTHHYLATIIALVIIPTAIQCTSPSYLDWLLC